MMIMWHLYACRQAVLRSSHQCDRLLLHWPTTRLAVLLPLQLRSGWIDTRCLHMNSDGDDGWWRWCYCAEVRWWWMIMMFIIISADYHYPTLLLGIAFGSLFQVLALLTLIFVFEEYLYSKAISTNNDFSPLKTSDLDSSTHSTVASERSDVSIEEEQ